MHDRRENGEDIRSTLQQWLDETRAPEDRLLRFDAWLSALLAEKIEWPRDPGRRRKLLGQCRTLVEGMIIELRNRGWLFDGKPLAAHVQAAIEEVAKAQKEGRIEDLWPFFRALMHRYVGTRAEELREQAYSTRCHITQILDGLDRRIPDMVARRKEETLKEKLAKRRQSEVAKAKQKDQLSLL